MLIDSARRVVTFFATMAFLFTTLIGGANAAMVGTLTAVDTAERADQISEVRDWLMQDRVREQLASMGVDPGSATERVATMTDDELRMLHGKIEALPAGAGVVEVIGLVFIVLLILELMGITHVFSHI